METIPDNHNMARLKAIKPRLGTLKPRIGVASGDERGRDRQRDQAAPWRGWYRTKRWSDLRMYVFVRDGFKCQRTGTLLVGKHPAPNSPVANHKRRHFGNPELFWDPDNIETVAKFVHDGEIQKQEREEEARQGRPD